MFLLKQPLTTWTKLTNYPTAEQGMRDAHTTSLAPYDFIKLSTQPQSKILPKD